MYIETNYEYTVKRVFRTPEAAEKWIAEQPDSSNYDSTEWQVH